MAKIKAGILSKVSGKVAGVVGGTWKGTNYLRELVKPANPNTALQQAQRSLMKATVRCARTLTGDVFKPFLDKFLKNMSGYNWFVKNNIKKFNGTDNALASALVFSTGNMQTGSAEFGLSLAGVAIATGDSVPAVASGHKLITIGIIYDDTKGIAIVKTANDIGANENVLGSDDWGDVAQGDKVCLGLFFADEDANGVIQAISSSLAQFGTVTA